MKRPLALFAVSFFAIQLLAINLPQQVLLPIAAILVCVFVLCMIKKKVLPCVVLGAAVIAFVWNVVYVNVIIKPNFKYINEICSVTAQVKSTTQYSTSYMSADLTVYEINGKNVPDFNVKTENMPFAQIGEFVNINLKFKQLTATKRLYSYTDGVFLAADYVDGFKSQHKYSIFYYANQTKQFLSGKIQILMPDENGFVASAMAFGDKSKLTDEIKNSFKAAGLSHLLVVSGMHLAAASGIAVLLFNLLFKKRQLSAAASILFIIVFIFITGITPSALRAGMMIAIAMLGMCFFRQADSFTSIAFAGLLMCIYNPYICYDVGFLLSYAATLGVLFSNEIIKKMKKAKLIKNKILFFIIKIVAMPFCATLATMPILILFNLGVSVLGIIFNILITPLLGVITTLTFSVVAFSSISIFAPLAFAVSFINSAVMSVLLFAVSLADKIPWSLIYIGGAGTALIVIALYVLLYLQIKKRNKYGLVIIAVFFMFTSIINYAARTSTVMISPISKNQNSSVLLWVNNTGVLINREKTVDVEQVNSFLRQNNIRELKLIINMHKEGTELNQLNAVKTVNIYNDFNFSYSYEPFADIIITVHKQEKGAAAYLDINGFVAVLNNGEYNYKKDCYADVYISGISRGVNISADNVIFPGNAPRWLSSDNVKQNAKILVNKNHLYKIYEGFYGFD